jgi:hypothetical protein
MTSPDNPTAPQEQTLAYTAIGNRPHWAQILLSPIGWPTYISCACVYILFFIAGTVPDFYATPLAIAILSAFAVAFYYGLRLLLRGVLVIVYKDPTEPMFKHVTRWLIPPAIALLIFITIYSYIPLRIAFHFSRNAMDKLPAAALAAGGNLPNQQVGWFEATHIKSLPGGGVKFFVKDTGFLTIGGFAYLPPTATMPAGPFRAKPFAGNWYIISEG